MKKHDNIYIPSINNICNKVLNVDNEHCYVKIDNDDGSEYVVKKVKFKDAFLATKRNKELLDELYESDFEVPPPLEKSYFEYESLLYVPALGNEIYEVCTKIGKDCYVSYYSYDELDDVLFKVDKYNAFLANRKNRLLLDTLYNKRFSPTIYDNDEGVKADSLSGDDCVSKMLSDGMTNILCKTAYKEIVIIVSVDDVETFTDVKNKTYALLTPIELNQDGIYEIYCDSNGDYYTVPYHGKF